MSKVKIEDYEYSTFLRTRETEKENELLEENNKRLLNKIRRLENKIDQLEKMLLCKMQDLQTGEEKINVEWLGDDK